MLYMMVKKEHDDRWDKLDNGDTTALVAQGVAAGKVLHHDDRAPKFYERTWLLMGSLTVMFAALVFVMLSVEEVKEMGKQCGSEPCKNGARCTDVVLGTDAEGTKEYAFKCVCLAGFDGTACDNDIDECGSSPCQNGGACEQSDVNEYSCSCISGFYGERCQAVRPPSPTLCRPALCI